MRKSLVLAGEQRAGRTRYEMLETLRQYAQERLDRGQREERLASGWRTSIFHQPERFPYRLERILPQPLAVRLGREFRRFSHPGLDPALVRRCETRRDFMRTTLGLPVHDDVLPLSNLAGIVPVYMLRPGLVPALRYAV